MHALCPHCRAPLGEATTDAGAEALCPACGGKFLAEGSTTGYEPGPGGRLAKFELIDVLGHGGFGTVYKARDTELDRVVALKVPRTGSLLGPKEQERFFREARSAAQLRHPAIVAVHEVGTADGAPYLVSDFVEGVTLADLLSARRPSFREAAELVATIADALQYAHERGVVHRDVKPANIMVGVDGKPYVMDFGLAKREAGEITMTVEGQVLGTPAYMPPEQARGEGHSVDGRSDVYSLGVVLYRVLTDELPFRGTSRMVLHQALHDEPRPPRALNDAIPRDLETVTLKAMAKEPGRRYQSAREFADELRRWLAGKGILARPAGRLERAYRWARRRPAVAALTVVGGVAALAVTALAVSAAFLVRLEEARAGEEGQRKRAEASLSLVEEARYGEEVQRKRAVSALELADRLAYTHAVFLAEQALRENNLAAAEARLLECKVRTGWEWRYLMARCRPELFSVPGSRPALSPDGARLVTQGDDGRLRVYDGLSGRELLSIKAEVEMFSPVYSPDGKVIAAGGQDGVVRTFDATTGKELHRLKASVLLLRPTFSPDGSRIAVQPASKRVGGDEWIRLYDARTGEGPVVLKAPKAMYGMAFSPDGARLAVGCADDVMRLYDARTGEEVVRLKPPASVSEPVFSPDGARIAFPAAQGAGLVCVCDARTGDELLQLKDQGSASLPAYSPDGTRIAIRGGDRVMRLYDARTGRVVVRVSDPHGLVRPVFSADGALVAVECGDRAVRLYDVRTGEERHRLLAPSAVSTPVFSPDGARVAVGPARAVKGGVVRVYDARGGAAPLRVPTFGGLRSAAFSCDGERLALASEGVVRVVDLRTGEVARRLDSAAPLSGPALSPDGALLAAAAEESGSPVLVFDARTGKQTARFVPSIPLKASAKISYPEFSPDGARVVYSAYPPGVAWVFDARTGREVFQLKATAPLVTAAFSPDGAFLAAASDLGRGSDGVVRLFDARTGRESRQLKANVRLTVPYFSPDGSLLAVGTAVQAAEDRSVAVFDPRTGRELPRLRAARGATTPRFSRDGSRIAVCSGHHVVHVFEARTGKEQLTLKAPGSLFSGSFSPDGSRVLARQSGVGVTGDGVVRLYDAQTGDEVLQIKEADELDSAEFSPDGARILAAPGRSRATGGLRIYEAPADLTAWQARRREAFREALPAWRRARAEAAEQSQDWFVAAFHWGWLAQEGQENAEASQRRERALVRLRGAADQ